MHGIRHSEAPRTSGAWGWVWYRACEWAWSFCRGSGKIDLMPVALVTGASRGIGRAIAVRLARDGYDLFLVAREKSHLDDTIRVAAASQARSHRAIPYGIDLSLSDSPYTIAAEFRRAFDRLDLLVNNAGIALGRELGEYTGADWDLLMNVNARAPFFLIQELLPELRAAAGNGDAGAADSALQREAGATPVLPGEAVIINIASVVAKKGYEKQAVYGASKHALLGFTKSIARDLARENIRVHAVLPGGVNTEMVTGVRPDINTDELIVPDEIADVVVNLLTMRGNAVIDEVEIRRRTKSPWA